MAVWRGLEGRPSMDRMHAGERDADTVTTDGHAEAIEFVRFCHRRRRVGWPELYDEMCAVAGRGLYRGYGPEELGELGIGFGLFQMPALAGLVARVVAEDLERRRRTADALRATAASQPEARSPDLECGPVGPQPADVRDVREPIEATRPDHAAIRIAVA